MASTTKYTAAPTEEPHNDYSQAPPAYQSTSGRHDEPDDIFASPRASEDNLPDDFKVYLLHTSALGRLLIVVYHEKDVR